MTRRGVLRFLCVLTLGLSLFDSIADAVCCDEVQPAAVACHACSCGPHIAPQAPVRIADAPAPRAYESYEAPAYAFLLPTSIFHPPCLAA